MAKMAKPKDVDSYIASFPKDVQTQLQSVRKTIRTSAPMAEEVISYGMPGYKYLGMLVFFAGWKEHLGFYPAGRLTAFEEELKGYERSKGTIQFPFNKRIPLGLIGKIVKYRVKENEEKLALKRKSKPSAK